MSNFLLQIKSGLSIYFWIIKSLCLILKVLDFEGDFFSGEEGNYSVSATAAISSGDYGSS